jgi:hypothetical protein
MAEGARLLRTWAAWDYDARLQLMALLAANPELTVNYPGAILYDAIESAELGEPGALDALIKSQALAQRSDRRQGGWLRARNPRPADDMAITARSLPECAMR